MFELILFIGVTATGFISGRIIEKRHLARLLKDEAEVQHIGWRSTGLKESFENKESKLVYTSVVIGQDAFKALVSGLTNTFGGRMSAYESLMERARREAILRLRKQAHAFGAQEIINMRLDACSVSPDPQKSGAFEIVAYGTAIKPQRG